MHAQDDIEHLRILSILYYVLGGLGTICSCLPIFHFVMGIGMMVSPGMAGPGGPGGPSAGMAAGAGFFFAAFAALIMLMGWTFSGCMIYAGRCLSQYRKRTFCIVMAGIACTHVPLGTALGVCTLVVLLKPTVRELFDSGGTTPFVPSPYGNVPLPPG